MLSADDGFVCHPECSADGCWGAGERNCLRCANFDNNGQCVSSCYNIPGLYAVDSRSCGRCHPECERCDGPVSLQLTSSTSA